MTFNEFYVHYYEKNRVNKMLLGLSEDELSLIFSKVNSADYEKALENMVCIAELFAKRLSLGEDYYDFIKEYIFKHSNEIIKISSDMQILGYMSTVQNLFSSLCEYESLNGIANYINSKPLSFFYPEEFIKNNDGIIDEFPRLVRFFDAFKTENKIVTDKDDLALDANSYSVSNSAKNIRNEIFDNLRNNCEKDWVKQNEDIELVITPNVCNAFLYQNDCEGHFYASFENGHYAIRECIAHNEEDKHALIDRVLKIYPFVEFIYDENNLETISLLKKHGFVDSSNILIRRALENIDYPDWYYPRCNFEYKKVSLNEDMVEANEFIYKGETYVVRLGLFPPACIENILCIEHDDLFFGIIGINVKHYFITNNCRYIVYQNFCSKKGEFDCFDVETGKISSYNMVSYNFEDGNRDIDDFAFAKQFSIQTGYIAKTDNFIKYVPTFSVRKNCMYLPYNVPDNAIAYVGFNVITHTVVVYNSTELDKIILEVLEKESFGNRIRIVKSENELYCDRYSDKALSKTLTFWSEKLKELFNAYHVLFNRPFQLEDELPGSLLMSGNVTTKYNAFKDYFRKYRNEFNLSYILDFEEIDTFLAVNKNRLEFFHCSGEKMLENTHIVFKALFDYGYSSKKVRQFYKENSLFFDEIYMLKIEGQTVNGILKFIKSMAYYDKDYAVQMLLPNVLMCKSGRRRDFIADDELLEAYETLTNQD